MPEFFKEDCMQVSSNSHLGLCDDGGENEKQPAYLDDNEKNSENWIAFVHNPQGKEVRHFAIDKCVNAIDTSGNTISTCDSALRVDKGLYLVELKNKRSNWITAAKAQILSTITVLERYGYDKKSFKPRKAYLANKKHPDFSVSSKSEMQEFKQKHKFTLLVQVDINI